MVATSSDVSATVDLLSPLAWPCRRGGGAGFLSVEAGGVCTGVDDECDAFGGVGGLGGGTGSTSGSMSISGILPAASVSKMLSLASSSTRLGGGGKGLFTSVGLVDDDLLGDVGDTAIGPKDGRRPDVPCRPLSFSSTLISFPCLVAGGGGGFLRDPVRWAGGAGALSRLSASASGSEVSCEVRGVSGEGGAASDMDCLDEASVMLPLSPATPVERPALGNGPWPVNSNLLNASTSIPALPAPGLCSLAACPPSTAARSISSRVCWNGLGGGPPPIRPTGVGGNR